jgi:hypothetical protein
MALLKSLSQISPPGLSDTKNAWLAEYNDATGDFENARAFQYYPEQVSDNRNVNIEEKYGIGSSHPIYQWVRGSSREISFDAVFSTEDPGSGSITDTVDKISGFIKNPATAAASALLGKAYTDKKHNQNIPAAINWLRSFTYPTYSNSVVKAPPRCALWLQGSGISSFVDTFETDVITCIMTKCDVTYEAFFNNGTPRIVTVSLQFVETIQIGANWKYVDGKNIKSAGNSYTGPVDARKLPKEKNKSLAKKVGIN